MVDAVHNMWVFETYIASFAYMWWIDGPSTITGLD